MQLHGARHTVGTDIRTYVHTYVRTRVQSDFVRREGSQEDTDRVRLLTLCHSPNSGEMGRPLDSASFSRQYICGWGERKHDSWHNTGSAQLQRASAGIASTRAEERAHT